MKKYIILLSSIFLLSFKITNAFCPVCTIAVGAGIGLTKYLGIDDTITGLWIGALIISLSMWTINWLAKKNKKSLFIKIITYIFYIALIIIPLFFMKSVFHPFNVLWGINKLILGIILGAFIFYIDAIWYANIKKNNNGKPHFPFEKVVIPVLSLILLSFAFYLITK